MKPYHTDKRCTLYHGDCLQVLQTLPDDSIDACVTDPPYGLAFMNKRWDCDVPSVEIWQQVLRVLKPGGHLLAFAGTRTQHRMACRIEDAGFEIRDMIAWVYGSGFPKSLDVSKAIDKAAGVEREIVSERPAFGIGGHGCLRGHTEGATMKTDAGPATEAAKQWSGYGTALKPALEPITVARKPLVGTVAENVLQYGTGGINVDACRVGAEVVGWSGGAAGGNTWDAGNCGLAKPGEARPVTGRWPANLIHDGSEQVVSLFPETSPSRASAGVSRSNGVLKHGGQNARPSHGTTQRVTEEEGYSDAGGSAARFFYTAKADSSERRGSKHPTVKPLDLMRYLVRLVCPVGAVVLDPFSGSGTTIEAARAEHCRSIGIELNEEYLADTLERLTQGVLF